MMFIPDAGTAPLAPAAAGPAARFVGNRRTFVRLLARGALRLMLTLGIYRFWLATDVRRFLWGNTLIGEDGLEYTGTPRELLVGFLMAVAILIPINFIIFIAALDIGLVGEFSGIGAFIFLGYLGQFALYRARRYRLTRTVYRGIRFHQSGNAWTFALRSMLWWSLTALTLGLAYPWMQSNLERYKLAHTHYGNLDGRFVGSGTRLFVRGIFMWMLVMVPLAASLLVAVLTIDWIALATAAMAEGDILGRIEAINPDFAGAIVLALLGIGWSVLAATLLYPVFRAMVLRWWISGVRLGDMTAQSQLRTGQVYSAYARLFWFVLLFGFAALIVALVVFGIGAALISGDDSTRAGEVVAAILFVATYVAIALGYSTIYQATVTIRLWVLSFETTRLTGLAALENVPARGSASSPLGEGLADALDVGGL
jgi:uncharacterized membrane protein YjgN (DUF898 family)